MSARPAQERHHAAQCCPFSKMGKKGPQRRIDTGQPIPLGGTEETINILFDCKNLARSWFEQRGPFLQS
jgi:hypothetical protein